MLADEQMRKAKLAEEIKQIQKDFGGKTALGKRRTEIAGAVSAAFNDYVRNELNYPIDDRFYLIGDVRPWKYADGKYLNVLPELRYSMFVNPNMEILVAI